MSTLAQLFESGSQKGDKGHFRNLVMLTRVDGSVAPEETALLNRIARRLSLTDEQVKEIMENEQDYPMIPPVSLEERYERLIRFVKMVNVDGDVADAEKQLVFKYGVALGFDEETIENKFDTILTEIQAGKDTFDILDMFVK